MTILYDIKSRIKPHMPIIIGIVICLYFGFHAFTGERGVGRFLEVKKELTEAQQIELKTLNTKEFWEKRVEKIKFSYKNFDFIEEIARKDLNFGNKYDYIVVVP